MKKIIAIAIVTLSLSLTVTSCKKSDSIQPEAKVASPAPVAKVAVTVSVALVEDQGFSINIVNPKIVFLDENGVIDTTIQNIPIKVMPTTTYINMCGVTGINPVTYSTTITPGAKIKMQVFIGTTKIIETTLDEYSFKLDGIPPTLGNPVMCGGMKNMVLVL